MQTGCKARAIHAGAFLFFAPAGEPPALLRTIAMLQFREFLKSGHAPTLWSSFLYFGFSCAVWVINGAMAPFIRSAERV